jgi:hypothetical protein
MAEDGIAKIVAEQWRCTERRRVDDPNSEIDRVFLRDDKIMAYGEIKCRECAFGAYADYRIGKAKVETGRALAIKTGKPVFLIVGFNDSAIAFVDVNAPCKDIGLWGRDDRGDPADKEMSVAFNWSRFKFIRSNIPFPFWPHYCERCGDDAPYGYGVSLRRGIVGKWYCGDHRPDRPLSK